jgi:hypothetical protein
MAIVSEEKSAALDLLYARISRAAEAMGRQNHSILDGRCLCECGGCDSDD